MVCSGLANEIASISEGRLGLVSLQDPGIQRIVSIGENGEFWKPYLIHNLDNGQSKVYSGILLALKLSRILGVRRSYLLAQMLGDAHSSHSDVHTSEAFSRRGFIRAAVGAGLAFTAVTQRGAFASTRHPYIARSLDGILLKELREMVSSASSIELKRILHAEGFGNTETDTPFLEISQGGKIVRSVHVSTWEHKSVVDRTAILFNSIEADGSQHTFAGVIDQGQPSEQYLVDKSGGIVHQTEAPDEMAAAVDWCSGCLRGCDAIIWRVGGGFAMGACTGGCSSVCGPAFWLCAAPCATVCAGIAAFGMGFIRDNGCPRVCNLARFC